jgi:hypothetical protein
MAAGGRGSAWERVRRGDKTVRGRLELRGCLAPLDGFVTYDERQAAAARLAGLRTMSPGA